MRGPIGDRRVLASARFGEGCLSEAIAHPVLGEKITGVLWVFFQFISQVPHIDVDVVDTVIILRAPDALQDLLKGKHLVGILGQIGQQPILGCGEFHRLPAHEDPAQVQIYDDDRGKLPYVESITGRILPCGKYQSKTRHRKCVIEFKVKRMAELRKRNLTRDELYKYSHLEVGTGTVKYPTP